MTNNCLKLTGRKWKTSAIFRQNIPAAPQCNLTNFWPFPAMWHARVAIFVLLLAQFIFLMLNSRHIIKCYCFDRKIFCVWCQTGKRLHRPRATHQSSQRVRGVQPPHTPHCQTCAAEQRLFPGDGKERKESWRRERKDRDKRKNRMRGRERRRGCWGRRENERKGGVI